MSGGKEAAANKEAAAAAGVDECSCGDCLPPELEQQLKALAGSNLERYTELFLEALSVAHEQGQPRMFLQAFHSMDDAKAAVLNDMVERYRQEELELEKRSRAIQKEVNKAFHDLINK